MESVGSFSVTKAGKAYVVKVGRLHPDGVAMLFHIDSGASVTLLGLNSFCDEDDTSAYNLLRDILEREIQSGRFEKYKASGFTATDEEIEMYPCKYYGASISETMPMTLYFHIYLGNIGMPLLGFDYIDDCSFHHSVGGELVISAVAGDAGKRFYPKKVIDFNQVLEEFCKKR